MKFNVTLHTSGRHGAGTITGLVVEADDDGRPPELLDDLIGYPGAWHLVGFTVNGEVLGTASYAATTQ